jgi:hypothetical protein
MFIFLNDENDQPIPIILLKMYMLTHTLYKAMQCCKENNKEKIMLLLNNDRIWRLIFLNE